MNAAAIVSQSINGQEIYDVKESFNGIKQYFCQICEKVIYGEISLVYHDGRKEHKNELESTEMLSSDHARFQHVECEIVEVGNILYDQKDPVKTIMDVDVITFEGLLKKIKKSVHVKVLKKTDSLAVQVGRERDALNRVHENSNVTCKVTSLFDIEEFDDSYVIAYERSLMSLLYGVKNKKFTLPQIIDILRDTAKGLEQIHNSNDIHRNIRPETILIFETNGNFRAKISNLLLSKHLAPGCLEQSVSKDFYGKSFTAPELYETLIDMNSKRTVTKAVDTHSLGCVFYFAMTGLHWKKPKENFNHILWKNLKIVSWEVAISEKLITCMTFKSPQKRPELKDVLNFPMLWEEYKIKDFIMIGSSHIENFKFSKNSQHRKVIDTFKAYHIIDGNWKDKVDSEIIDNLVKSKRKNQRENSYGKSDDELLDGSDSIELLRAARNILDHCSDPQNNYQAFYSIKNKFSDHQTKRLYSICMLDGGPLKYWLMKFPQLLPALYDTMQEVCREFESLKPFYCGYNFNQ